jgi:hypothetical protein
LDKISTYAILSIPEGIATTFVLIWLSLSLAPWLGGTEIGPLKIPRLDGQMKRWLRLFAPLGLVLFILGFVRLWPSGNVERAPRGNIEAAALDFDSYARTFFDPTKKEQLKGSLFLRNELEIRQLQSFLGNSRWDGGSHWGAVSFDGSGRTGNYTNDPDRSPGRILIQGAPPGTVPALYGEWHQEDGQKGRVVIFTIAGREKLTLRWGPGLTVESVWTRLPDKGG